MSEELSKEQRVLRMMRKVLAGIIKDTTPQPGMKHPLSQHTLEDIRDCLALIAAREAEVAEGLGLSRDERPYYVDEKPQATVVKLNPAALRKDGKDGNGK